MKLSEFKFDLPNNLIALRPAENRDEARLMVVHKDSGKIEHKIFKDIVVCNDPDCPAVGVRNGQSLITGLKQATEHAEGKRDLKSKTVEDGKAEHQKHCRASQGFVCSCVNTPSRKDKFL